MKKKVLKASLLSLCAVALVVCSVLATLAFLADSSAVSNTFTVGNVGIDMKETAVDENGKVIPGAANVFGQDFMLQDYLKFGIKTADTEEEMKNSIPDRESAVEIASEPLHNYYETGAFELAPGGTKYIALIVRMPEEVGNVANYRGDTVPEVDLGITVKADQIKKN